MGSIFWNRRVHLCGPACLILRGLWRSRILQSSTPQKMVLAGSPSPQLLETSLGYPLPAFIKNSDLNPAKMGSKSKNFCSRRFGHRAVRSETRMPQTYTSRALWPPTTRWPNPSSAPQSLSFTTSRVAGFFAGGLPGCLRGRIPQVVLPQKAIRRADAKGQFAEVLLLSIEALFRKRLGNEEGHVGWLRLDGSLETYVSFAKEPYEIDYILQKRPIFFRSLVIIATPY